MAKQTYAQIQKEIERLQREGEKIRRQEAVEVAAKIREAIAVYGFTADDLFGNQTTKRRKAGPTRRAKVKKVKKAKYADGTGNTWSGMGPRPAWFRSALEAGKKAEELLA
ncbi:H-NS family nucleoid-associated regulatory protein [Achromobacter pestifer]|uniref:DNA-binding protein H-NS-like C-terminal domain-containing protein n=1 Tax=Achromobacter pestifer TaxID=1353889 RepID=A0A6S6YV40_9BURK|nr:H-NS histone family protein [Achromobacter pestifer]CAB3647518.1 hypothetical protein LMG3431_02576 [Achromobacter pestifer]